MIWAQQPCERWELNHQSVASQCSERSYLLHIYHICPLVWKFWLRFLLLASPVVPSNMFRPGFMILSLNIRQLASCNPCSWYSYFYSTPSTKGVESTRGNSVSLSVCLSVRNHYFLLRIFNNLMIQTMQTIYFLKAHHAGNQYRPVLTQYHRVPTSTALYWPSIQWFDGLDHVNQIFSKSISHWQPVPPCLDPVSPNTDQYHPILTQYHQVTTSTTLYPAPPSTNK